MQKTWTKGVFVKKHLVKEHFRMNSNKLCDELLGI